MFVFRSKNHAQIILVIILSIFMIVATNFLLQAGMSCVDKNGCLKESCQETWFNNDFRIIIIENKAKCAAARAALDKVQ